MHHPPTTMKTSITIKRALSMLCATTKCVIAFTPSLTSAKKYPNVHRKDKVIGTDSSGIIIKEDSRSGDRIIRVKPKKQKEEDCNKYTDGQYPIIIKLEPDISNYKK